MFMFMFIRHKLPIQDKQDTFIYKYRYDHTIKYAHDRSMEVINYAHDKSMDVKILQIITCSYLHVSYSIGSCES